MNTEKMKILNALSVNLNAALKVNHIPVSQEKNIQSGVQFLLEKGMNYGFLRIYIDKKGVVKIDFSTFDDFRFICKVLGAIKQEVFELTSKKIIIPNPRRRLLTYQYRERREQRLQ